MQASLPGRKTWAVYRKFVISAQTIHQQIKKSRNIRGQRRPRK
jgi:hypothetical protein